MDHSDDSGGGGGDGGGGGSSDHPPPPTLPPTTDDNGANSCPSPAVASEKSKLLEPPSKKMRTSPSKGVDDVEPSPSSSPSTTAPMTVIAEQFARQQLTSSADGSTGNDKPTGFRLAKENKEKEKIAEIPMNTDETMDTNDNEDVVDGAKDPDPKDTDNRATDQGALTMIAMSTTEPITENGEEDETLINLSNLSQDDLPSITSSEEKFLLEGDSEDDLTFNESETGNLKTKESANLDPTVQSHSSAETETTTKNANAIFAPEPVNFDLIPSGNESNDGSSSSQPNVNISQVVSSVIDKLQIEDESSVSAIVAAAIAASGSDSSNMRTSFASFPTTQEEETSGKKLPSNETPSESSSKGKKTEKEVLIEVAETEEGAQSPATATAAKVFSHQIKSSFNEKRLELIEAANDCYGVDKSAALPAKTTTPAVKQHVPVISPGQESGDNSCSDIDNGASLSPFSSTLANIIKSSGIAAANDINKTIEEKENEKEAEEEDPSDAETEVITLDDDDDDDGNDFDLEEKSRWAMDGTLSELQSLDPKLQQEVDHNLAYQMQLEMDRDPRALAYFYSAHGKEKGGDAAAKLRASGSKAKSKSLQSSSTDDVSAREKKIIKAICASSLVEMQQGLPSTSSSSTSTLTPGPTFENTSLVKSSKFLARLAGEDCGNDDDDDDNDEEEEEDDDTMGEEYEDYGGSGGDSGNEEEEEEDDEPIETDDAEVNAERQRRAMERMGGKRKGGPPSKVHISDYVKLGLSGGKQPRRRPPPLAGASVGAVASSQRRLHRQKLRTIVPPSNNAKTATKTATTSGKQQQTAGESSSKKVAQVVPINADDDDDEDDDELSFLIGRGEEATEEEARAQAIEEARMKQEQRGLTSNQQSGSSSHHHRQQDPSRAWAVEYNGEYAGDFDEALRAALAASMETATIEQQQHHGSMSVGGGSSIDDHHNYHQKAPEHQLQAPGYSRDSYYSTLPPPPTSPSTTANDNSSSHALQTLCAIAVNDENREPSTSSKQPQQQPLFSGLSLPGARPRSRGMYNLQLHHHQSHLMNAGSDEGGKDGSKENAEDTVTGARKAATTIIKTSGGGEGKTSGAHANKVRFAARENVIPYPGSSSTSTTSPLAGDTFSAAVASVSPSTSASTSTAAFTNRGHYPDLLLSNRALSTFSSSSHPFVCFLCPRRFAPCEPELVPRAAASQLRNENFEMSYQLLEHMQHHTYECLRCFHCGRANFQSTDELREHMLENVSVSYIEERLAAEKFYARRWTVLYLKMLEEGLHVGPHFGPRAAAHYTSKSWCAMCRVAIKEEEVRKVFEEGENLSPFSLETSPGTTVLQTALTSPFTPASSLALARAVSASASSSSLLSPLSSSKTATHYEVMDHLCRHIAYWRYVCTLCLEQGVLAFPSVVASAASNRRESDSEMTGNQQPPGRALTHLSIEAGLRALEEAPEARRRFLEYRRATERCCFTVVEPVAVMRHMMAYHHKNYGRQAEDAELITRWVASGPAEQYVRRSVREIINLTAAHRERNGLGIGAAQQHQQLPAALMDSHQEQERYSKLDLDWMMRQANESGWNLLIAVSTDPTLVQTLENFLASPCSTSTFAEPEQEQQWVRLIREERRLSASLRKAVRRIFPANDRNNNTGSGNHTGGGGSEYLGEVITLDDGEEGERERMRIAAATLARMAGRGGVSNNGGEDNGYEAETEMNEQHLGKGEAKKRRLLDEEDGEPNSMITEDSSSTAKSSSATTSSSSQAIVKSSSILPSPPTSLPEEEAENSRPVQTGNYRLPCFLCRIFFDITQVEVFVRHMESAHLLKKELVAGRRWAHLFAATFIKKRQREKMPLPWFEWCPMCTLLQPPSKRGVPEEDCLPTAPIRDGLIFMAADHFAQHFSYLRFRCLICDRAHQRPFEVIRDIEAIHGRQGGGCNTRQEENECLQAGNTGADFPLLFRSHIPFVNPLTVVDHLEAYHNEDYRLTNAADVIFRREMNISFLERMFLDMYRRTGNHYEPEKFIYIKEETNIYAVKMHRQSLLHKFELILVEEKFEKEYREKENYPIQRTLHHLPSQYMT